MHLIVAWSCEELEHSCHVIKLAGKGREREACKETSWQCRVATVGRVVQVGLPSVESLVSMVQRENMRACELVGVG